MLTAAGKWINLADTTGLGDGGFDARGRLRGLGWSNIWVFAAGGELRPVSWLALRLGYNYAENALSDQDSIFNIGSPIAVSHNLSGGLGVSVTDQIEMSVAYYHGFENHVTGTFIAPGVGPIPGSKVRNQLAENSLGFQFSFKL